MIAAIMIDWTEILRIYGRNLQPPGHVVKALSQTPANTVTTAFPARDFSLLAVLETITT